MLKRSVALLLTLFSFSCFAAPTSDKLFSVINERLSYMEDVALFKAQKHKAIEDIKREEVVIAKASASAAKAGLNEGSVVAFFKAQISAAKAIQYRYRADLLSHPVKKEPRDLKTVIRPALIKLGGQINSEMAGFLAEGGELTEKDWPSFKQTLQQQYLNAGDKRMLFDALSKVELKK